MSTQVAYPPAGRTRPRPRPAAAWRVLADLPLRLPLVLVWSSVVVALLVVLGRFRPLPTVVGCLVVVALTWRLAPGLPVRLQVRSAGIGGLLALLLAVGFAVVNLPFVTEGLLLDRDPDVYTLTAWWLVDHPAPGVPVPGGVGVLGFPLDDGQLRPQGQHLLPALVAVPAWVLGPSAVLSGNVLLGAVALLALYAAARLLVGPYWALLPPAALGVSLPMVAFSRGLYTEPVALALTWTGVAVLLGAARSGRLRHFAVAGVAFGTVSLARIDGLLLVIGLVGGLAVVTVARSAWFEDRRRWAALAVGAAALPVAVLAYLDLRFWSGTYVVALASQIELLRTTALASAVLALVLVLVPWPRRLRERVERAWPGLLAVGAAGVVVAFAVLASRPWWHVARSPMENGIVAGLQAEAGVPVDPARTYAELSVSWLAWFQGWHVVGLGVLGLALLLLRSRRSVAGALVVLTVLPAALVYLWQPSITPDLVWATRRFLPVVMPALLLGVAVLLRHLSGLGTGRVRMVLRVLALAVVVPVLVFPVITLDGLFRATQKQGVEAGVQRLCDAVGDRPTVVVGANTYLPTVRAVCEVPAVRIEAGDAASVAAAVELLGTQEAAVVTGAPTGVPWEGPAPGPAVSIPTQVWEKSLLEPPERVQQGVPVLWVGTADADGDVVPVEPVG